MKEYLSPEDALKRLNGKYFRSVAYDRFRVYERRWNSSLKRWVLRALTAADFSLLHRSALVTIEQGKPEPLGPWWLANSQAKIYENIEFNPDPWRESSPSTFNLFSGWPPADKPAPIDAPWPAIERHFHEVLANGDDELYKHLLDWFAWMLQRPHEPSGVILAIRGVQGSGKTSLGELGRALIGSQHYFHTSNPKHLLGHFNQHLEETILVFSDEAVWSGDRQGLPTLKSLATDPTFAVEAKGLPVRTARNCLHIILATNNDWVAPVEIGDRRFTTIETNSKLAQNAEHFNALHAEINGDALFGFRYALLTRPLRERLRKPDSITVRYNEIEQLRHSWEYGNTFLSWLDVRLDEGEMIKDQGWLTLVSKDRLYDDYVNLLTITGRHKHIIDPRVFGREMVRTFPMLETQRLRTGIDSRERCWKMPPLPVALDAMEARIGIQGFYNRLALLAADPIH